MRPRRTDHGKRRGSRCEPAAHSGRTVYSCAVATDDTDTQRRTWARALGRRRVPLTLGVSVLFGTANSLPSSAPSWTVTTAHAVVAGLVVLLAFGLLEQWPARLPRWLPRWILQLAGVVVGVPVGVLLAHFVAMAVDEQSAHQPGSLTSLVALIVEGLLFGPWIAFGAMLRQRDVIVRNQALRFDLERGELEREVSDARLRLLQAQVKPHFLFNTLANVQALVDAGSPQASSVLRSLVAYLRAAVPRLQESTTTIGSELELARAYLEVMHMRMPDRLTFSVEVDEGAAAMKCPPMTVLTLVENAVRHGIDPGEDGGRIDVEVRAHDGRCSVRVTDTGVGLAAGGRGLGSGLATLRERLELAFGGDAHLTLEALVPHGVRASAEFPART
jgi:signal transduction histidine kinase